MRKRIIAFVLAAAPLAALAGPDGPPCRRCASQAAPVHRKTVHVRHHAQHLEKPGGPYLVPPVVKNYWVGPMVDPENPDVRFGGGVVTRVVESPTWNLTPSPSIANIQGHLVASNAATLEAARLAQLTSQSASAAKVIQELQSQVEELKARAKAAESAAGRRDSVQTELRQLRETVEKLKQEMAANGKLVDLTQPQDGEMK